MIESFDNIEPEYRKSQKYKGRYSRYKTGGKNRCKKNDEKNKRKRRIG